MKVKKIQHDDQSMYWKLDNNVEVEHMNSQSSTEYKTMMKFASSSNKSRSHYQNADA